jgi:predicted DCC family thiol-disulfide oxidoreductase YuxK
MDHDGRLIVVDISDAAFDPAPYGMTLAELMYQMHVIDRTGTVFRGIEAFWAIWQAFPSSTLLGVCGVMISLPVINQIARIAYRLFARVRRFLPKRRALCATGSCRIDKRES